MSKYIIRLDDACEKRDVNNWNQVEKLLDKYSIKPLVGVIPSCKDPLMDVYPVDETFWERVSLWKSKGWAIALHGYEHVYVNSNLGINPVNARSEFAGLSLDEQRNKIKKGIAVLRDHGINPLVFFAPSHSFDENTLEALKLESDIRIVSDTPANRPYSKYGMTFVPQQSGKARKLPFNTVTFCYHPNTMCEMDFLELEQFIDENRKKFIQFPEQTVKRKMSLLDRAINKLYFARRKRK